MAENDDLGQQIARLTGKLETLATRVDGNYERITTMERRYLLPQARTEMTTDAASKLISDNLERFDVKQGRISTRIHDIEKKIHSHDVRLSVLTTGQGNLQREIERHMKLENRIAQSQS